MKFIITRKSVLLLLSFFMFTHISQVNISEAAQTSGITSGSVYNIKNVSSSKYLNVANGVDANGTNVYQYTADNSTEQKWKVVYDSTNDAYRFYTMSSSNGTNRVLDIVKTNGSVASGGNVQIYNPVDNVAQLWKIVSIGSGKYKIVPNSNSNVALTSYGSSNGTSGGKTTTSAGNVFVSTVSGNGTTNQQWEFTLVPTVSYETMNWTYMFTDSTTFRKISSGYKLPARSDHYAIDLVSNTSTAIYGVDIKNVYSGKVVVEGINSASAGNYVVVETDSIDPTTNKKLRVRYLHMKESPKVSLNSTISAGTVVGLVGNTGSVSPAPTTSNPTAGTHLHFDVNNNGKNTGINSSEAINPQKFFPGISFTGATSNLN